MAGEGVLKCLEQEEVCVCKCLLLEHQFVVIVGGICFLPCHLHEEIDFGVQVKTRVETFLVILLKRIRPLVRRLRPNIGCSSGLTCADQYFCNLSDVLSLAGLINVLVQTDSALVPIDEISVARQLEFHAIAFLL